MTTIQLVTQSEWYDQLPVSNELDFAWIGKQIIIAQEQYLKPCLTPDFYNEILTQYDTNTLTPENATLLNTYIKPFIAWRSFADSIVYLHGRVEANGIMVNKDDTSDAMSTNALSKFQSETANRADFFKIEMLNFLRDNKDDYPTYHTNCGCKAGVCRGSSSSIYTGWRVDYSRQ